eukprot:CAMPEP_0196143478 /NCGR_PEP_ID=MMETSP0910-20130528/13464_1 /TAXON_ID=49265 /ORGANISM="Thalassiosira rotula, Strain GSO102" /LENGTH=122 /DNA_ID=CAMNT_0041404947 /DNA_START=6 /DNA_END=374 /DNA_ORIENTATION=-
MARSTFTIAMFCLVALLSRSSNGFTTSLAPLLTARLRLGSPPGSKSTSTNIAPSSPSSDVDIVSNTKLGARVVSSSSNKIKPMAAQKKFQFEYDDIRMLSGCKRECLELVYAKSMDRGFASA